MPCTRACLLSLVPLWVACAPDASDDASARDLPSGQEWVHDPSRLVQEGDEWAFYGSGTEGMALTRSVVDLEHGTVRATEGLAADSLADGWWRTIQEWNPTGEFDAPTISDDGAFLAFTVFDEDNGELRDATGLATRTADGFAAAGVLLASDGEAFDTPRAMDASFVTTPNATFLVFGSHAGGIYVTELDPNTGLLLDDGETPETGVASERFIQVAQDVEAGIEAPYIHEHNDAYYLFANKGRCCSGVDSTYAVVMGRASHIEGPYLDASGKDLLHGGGSLFLATSDRFIGPGHVGIRD
ncbi:MAG TPA: hypothetical protein DFR83_24150, partial [Deltaproteobacteria bacterium]|nr:hypothetical protein [Deltaproteobacteria bacterium]